MKDLLPPLDPGMILSRDTIAAHRQRLICSRRRRRPERLETDLVIWSILPSTGPGRWMWIQDYGS
jgi:hypothetical protein